MFQLKAYNTFGVAASCRIFTKFTTINECAQQLDQLKEAPLILGAGSNILVIGDLTQPVMHNCIKGIEILDENDLHVWIRVGAGEIWNDIVVWAVKANLGGIENLSLIPGTMGAGPVQNIGAYGVELQSLVEQVKFLHLDDGCLSLLSSDECAFGYRESVFKRELWNKACILEVVLRLNKAKAHELKLDYGEVRQELENQNIKTPTIKDVSDTIVRIRRKKLPDPAVLGNAGSFFKNPVIGLDQFQELAGRYAGIPSYPSDRGMVKVPAAWLIERAGWKGYREGDAGVHDKHALVIINYGSASGRDLWTLAQKIISSVSEKFGVILQPEVNILGV